MKKHFIFFVVCLLTLCGNVMAQRVMSPPRVMVVPDLIYCKNHGYVQQVNVMGVDETVPDYERAVSEDPTLHDALTLVAQLITDRDPNIVIVDLVEAINNAKADKAMADANGGDESETVDEAIIRNSEADILVKVQFDMVKHGPQNSVSFTITGTDAYTSRMFAPISGLGAPSSSASPIVLLREAIYSQMDGFLRKVLSYYENMVTRGRMIAFDIKILGTSSVKMTSRVGTITLQEQIEDFIYDNSVEGNGTENVKMGATFVQYQGVYIPLIATIRGRQRKQGAKDVAIKLVNFLKGHSIDCDYKIRGLGKVNIYIK